MGHIGQRVELAGDAPTPAAMADALGVPFQQLPVEKVEARSADLAAMYRFLAETGYGIDVKAVRARYPELPLDVVRRLGGAGPMSKH